MKKTMLILLSLLLIFLIACQPAQKQPEQKEEIIKIGGLFALTGDMAVYGQPMKQAVDLAVEEINAQGGINNKKIQMVWEDGKCLPKDATTGMEKLANVDKVSAVVGEVCSSATLAAAPIAEEAGVVLLSPSSTNPNIKNAGDYIFRDVVSDDLQGKVGAKLAYNKGYKKAAVLYINNDYGVGLKDVFVKEFKELGGEVLLIDAFEQSSTDFRTQLTKVKNENPEVVYNVVYAVECAQILKQKEDLGIKAQFIMSEGCKDPSVAETAGKGAENAIVTYPKTADSPEFNAFKEAYLAKYPAKDLPAYAPESYDALKLIVLAIKNSDGSREGIKNALYQIKQYPGASGTITFDEFGEVEKPYTHFVITDGEYVEAED